MQLTAVDLTYRYRRQGSPILKGASVEAEPGSTVALVGPSGSGKTTMLGLLGGLLQPQAGKVLWDDQPPDARRADRVAWIFQTVNILGRRRVVDNVALGSYARRNCQRSALEAAATALHKVGLADLGHRRAMTLSGGEIQRVVVARALAGAPDLVLADEPTGQLDQAATAKVIQAILAAKPTSTTVVIATHDPDVAAACSRIVRVVDGRIEAQ